jgi:hypothetical protein
MTDPYIRHDYILGVIEVSLINIRTSGVRIVAIDVLLDRSRDTTAPVHLAE